MTLGTPGKIASVQLDTASSDLWFQTLNSDTCQASDSSCHLFTDYDVSRSSSAELIARNASDLVYGYGSANTDQYNETMTVGNVTFQNFPIRVAVHSKNLPFGIMGLGPAGSSVAAVGPNNKTTILPTFLQALRASNQIQSQSYSFYLNSSDSE